MMAENSTLPEETSPRVGAGVLDFEKLCQLVVLLFGARCAYAGRSLPAEADGLAYLDVARSYARLDWHTAVNGYWGPLYEWLLAIGLRIFHPGVRSEFALVRALNFALFAAALYTFSRFWRAVADWRMRIGDDNMPATDRFAWIALGYLLFVDAFVWAVDVVNPDILVAAIVFAIGAFLFKLNDPLRQLQHGIGAYAWLGLMLALGYYAKAILLYFAVFVLGAAVIEGYRSKRLWQPLIAALVFVVLVSPFVIILSRDLGHFTAGDSGKLNYAWFVNGPETITWEKDSPGAPLPFYPGPIVFDRPRVFHVPSIAEVTYAPWYDAARFDQRSHAFLNLRDQLRQLAINLHYPKALLGEATALTVPLLILVWYAPIASLRHFAASWFCTLPAAGVFGMYMLVHLVGRFVLGFSLLLWAAAWASVVILPGCRLLARRAVLTGVIVFAAYTMPGLIHYVITGRTESVERDMIIAEALPGYGIAPGDAVASIGNGQDAYWAHFAHVPVVAEVWNIDSAQFWSATPAIQQAALHSMAAAGAKAAIWRADSDRPCPEGWRSMPGSSGCIIRLQ